MSAAFVNLCARVDATVDRLLPKVRITRLLSEVARRTGFTDWFTELRSGKIHPNPSAVLAAVLADGTNLGLERMADSSQGVNYAQLAWTQAWYLSEETYAAALACIVDAQAALSLNRVWGDGTISSSDGQFCAPAGTPRPITCSPTQPRSAGPTSASPATTSGASPPSAMRRSCPYAPTSASSRSLRRSWSVQLSAVCVTNLEAPP